MIKSTRIGNTDSGITVLHSVKNEESIPFGTNGFPLTLKESRRVSRKNQIPMLIHK